MSMFEQYLPRSDRQPATESLKPTQRIYSDNPDDYEEVAIKDLDAFLVRRNNQADAPEGVSVNERLMPKLSDEVQLRSIVKFVNLLQNQTDSSQAPTDKPQVDPVDVDMNQTTVVGTSETCQSPSKSRRLVEIMTSQSRRRKFAAVGLLAVGAISIGAQHSGLLAQRTTTRLTAPFSLVPQGESIALIKLDSHATVYIPVAGFDKPLKFMENQKPVEPAASLKAEVSLTLATRIDKNGNPLPLAVVKGGDTFVVDRSSSDIKATVKDYRALNVDCTKPTTKLDSYCVAGSPIELKAGGKLTPATAKQLNDLLMAKGSNFGTYYEGVKAQLIVQTLAKLEQGATGAQIDKLADQEIIKILHNHASGAKISFKAGSKYSSISQNYATNFESLVRDKLFSIERGNGDTPDSLISVFQVNAPDFKGVKK